MTGSSGSPIATTPQPGWLERNWMHVGAWIGGALAFGAGFYDIEWGRRMGEAAPLLLAGGLGAFGLSGAYAVGAKAPTP